MRTRILFVLALLTMVACSMARNGQSQAPAGNPQATETPALKTKAYDVVLPVTVHDKKGGLVSGVKASDLALTEEGRAQTIKSFTQGASLPLRVGLLVQTTRSTSGALEGERKAAAKFVDLMLPEETAEGKEGAGKNQLFLIHFDREVELLEDLTASREKLHQEIDDMGPSREARNEAKGPETTGEDRSERQHGGRNGNQLYDAIFLASDEVLAPKDGRKALIVFSDGVDRGSKDRLNEALDAAEKAHVVIYTVFFKGEQERSEAVGSPSGRRGGSYPGGGYPGGGYPGGGGGYPGGGRRGGSPTSDYGVDGKKIMQQIAERSGGHAYEARKTEDFEPIYNLISGELRAQYLLTYTPDKPDAEGGFHKVAVKPAGKEEWIVAAPEGYFAPGGDAVK